MWNVKRPKLKQLPLPRLQQKPKLKQPRKPQLLPLLHLQKKLLQQKRPLKKQRPRGPVPECPSIRASSLAS